MVEYILLGNGISRLQELGEVTSVKISMTQANDEKLKQKAKELHECIENIDAINSIRDYVRVDFKELDANGEKVESEIEWNLVVYKTGVCYIKGITDYTDKIISYICDVTKN